MRIRKVSQSTPIKAKVVNSYSESEEETYSCDYMNEHSIVVSPTEPTGNDRRKVWFRKGKNLFDKSKALLGYWIGNEQGDIVKYNDDVFLTDFIPVFKNVPVYIPATGSSRREFYNKNKVGTTYLNNSKAQVFTPTEDGFIRVTCVISTVTMDSLMIYYGTTETEYEAYIEPQIFVKNSNGVYEEFIKKSEEVYSTEEVKIGTWIDGKPLYRKVYDGIALSGSETIVDTISGIDVKMIYGWLVRESASFIQPFGSYVAMDNTSTSRVFYGSPYIKVQAGADYQTKNITARVIVEYTKTTD